MLPWCPTQYITTCCNFNTQHNTTHNAQHTTHNAQRTIHNTQHTITKQYNHNTTHATHDTQHTTHNTQHTEHNTQRTTHNTQHTTHNTHNTHNTHTDGVCERNSRVFLLYAHMSKLLPIYVGCSGLGAQIRLNVHKFACHTSISSMIFPN